MKKLTNQIILIGTIILYSALSQAQWRTVTKEILDMDIPTKITSDATGKLYVIGETWSDIDSGTWITATSDDVGKTWKEVDRYEYSPDDENLGSTDILVHSNGDVYVIGKSRKVAYGGSPRHATWIVRRQKSNEPFKTVDVFQTGTGNSDLGPEVIREGNKGQIYVIGQVEPADQPAHIVIRVSYNYGGTWSELTSLPYKNYRYCENAQMAVAGDKIYASQLCDTGNFHITELYVTADEGKTWTLLDDPGSNVQSPIAEILPLSNGNLLCGRHLGSWVARAWEKINNVWTTKSSFDISPITLFEGAENRVWAMGIEPDDDLWTVEYSDDGGETWVISDQYEPRKAKASPASLHQDKLGRVFALGHVRIDQGETWRETVQVRQLFE